MHLDNRSESMRNSGRRWVLAALLSLCAVASTRADTAPTVAVPASANPAVVSGTNCLLSVLGADKKGEASLTYTWSGTGPATVSFSVNGSNPAKTTQAFFRKAGSYNMTVVIKNAKGQTVQSSVAVTVLAVPTLVQVSPATVALNPLTTCQFAAASYDQFNFLMSPPPTCSWSARGISITSGGLVTADGDASESYTILATCGSVFGSAILQINGVPTPPPPVITPAGGTFDEPLTVTITPAATTVLSNTPGWRTGVKYPGQGIETVEALSEDGQTVVAMRGRTMAKSSYMFPSASVSPDSGPFPFYIWSLADLNGPANPFMIYQPSLFAGVTENTAWDGNNYDFYYRETGNRVFLLLQQHYSHSISLWSCADGTYQYDTAQQMLTEFPLSSVAPLAGTPLSMEYSGDKVRVLVGGAPLLSAATDAGGWVTYTGTNGSGRVTAPLGATRFWLTMAGGEKPGKREMVVSDKPLVTTRYTYDGSPVTESSLVVTGKLTLTHDATIRARVYSAALYRSKEAVGVFTSTIPLLPSESYVSPVDITVPHATLDGSLATVSLSGPSGTTNALALGDNLFILRYPLSATGPTPVTLHRSGVPDLATNILWREIDLAAYARPGTMTIRLGDSLLLTAGIGQTGALHIAVMDGSNEVYRTCDGAAGEKFPVLFDQPGTFTAIATLDGISVGSLIVNVVCVDFDGPVACQVGYKREKGVAVYGPADQVYFTAKDPTFLEVSVKSNTAYGVRLYLKALARGTPVVQARLGSPTGPILAEQEVDEFTVDSSAATHVVVNGATDTANTILTMKPWIPNMDVNCAMFAHYSTFVGGATAYSINTSDFGAVDVNGDPAVELGVDPETGETQAVIRVDLEIPPDEDNYCFRASFDQHSKYGTEVGCPHINGTKCDFTPVPIYIAEGDLDPHVLVVNERPVTGNVTHDPGPPPHEHKMTPFKQGAVDYGLKFEIVPPTDRYNCLDASQWNASVKLKAGAKAGEKLSANICRTLFADVITVSGVEIQVNNTALETDDHVRPGAAPEVGCQARLVGWPAGNYATTLKNKPGAVGSVKFPNPATSLTVQLSGDGGWVPFTITGDAKSTEENDAMIIAEIGGIQRGEEDLTVSEIAVEERFIAGSGVDDIRTITGTLIRVPSPSFSILYHVWDVGTKDDLNGASVDISEIYTSTEFTWNGNTYTSDLERDLYSKTNPYKTQLPTKVKGNTENDSHGICLGQTPLDSFKGDPDYAIRKALLNGFEGAGDYTATTMFTVQASATYEGDTAPTITIVYKWTLTQRNGVGHVLTLRNGEVIEDRNLP